MRLIAMLLTMAPLAACATMADPDDSETAVPFVRSQGISEWRVAGEDALYVRGVTGRWYMVRTIGSCSRLPEALSLGFETSAFGELDRHGAITAEGQRCPIASVTRVAAPPPRSGSL